MSGNLGSRFGKLGKSIVKDEIIGGGVASGTALGASAGSFIGFVDGGLLTGMGTDIGTKVATDMGNRLTSDTDTPPDKIRCLFVTLFLLLTSTLKQSRLRLNRGLIIQHILVLVLLLRVQCLSMTL